MPKTLITFTRYQAKNRMMRGHFTRRIEGRQEKWQQSTQAKRRGHYRFQRGKTPLEPHWDNRCGKGIDLDFPFLTMVGFHYQLNRYLWFQYFSLVNQTTSYQQSHNLKIWILHSFQRSKHWSNTGLIWTCITLQKKKHAYYQKDRGRAGMITDQTTEIYLTTFFLQKRNIFKGCNQKTPRFVDTYPSPHII